MRGRGRQRQPNLRPIIKKKANMSTTTNASSMRTTSSAEAGCGSAVGDCAYSVAQSTVSLFSTGFTAQVGRLFSASAVQNQQQILSEGDWSEKEELIRATLAGDDEDGAVDLWKLRELALSPGGLLTPFLRRQAWPKLMACHEQVLAAANNSLPIANLVIPTSEDMRALKHDVSKTIWSVEQHLIASRGHEKVVDEKMQHFLEIQRQRSTRVRFAPETRDIVNEGDSTLPPAISRIESTESQSPTAADVGGVRVGSNLTIPETIETGPPKAKVISSAIEGAIAGTGGESLIGATGDVDSLLSTGDESLGGYCPSEATLSTNFTRSSRVVRWRKATIAEQKILYNVILSVLRTEAEPSEYFEDDRYHYFPGLQDLTAILMINLESPSLTSLVITKLAGAHLRDALRKDRIMIDTALAHSFMPLLESVDAELYLHLQRHGMTLSTFCRQWVACWFAQDVPDVDVASRLLDAFLAGHPLLPLYASVALLTSQRAQILQCNSHLSTLYSLLRGLPVQNLYEEDCRMLNAERVIATALEYMRKTSPEALVKVINSKSNASLVLDTIAMFQSSPAWCFASKAPNDYELLKRAQELREHSCSGDTKSAGGEPEFRKELFVSVSPPNPVQYPLSFAATGCFNESKPSSKLPMKIGSILAAIIIISLSAGILRSAPLPFVPSVDDATARNVIFDNLSARFDPLSLKKATSTCVTYDGQKEHSKLTSRGSDPKFNRKMALTLAASHGLSVNSKPRVSSLAPARKQAENNRVVATGAVDSRIGLAAIASAIEAASFALSLYPTSNAAKSVNAGTITDDRVPSQ